MTCCPWNVYVSTRCANCLCGPSPRPRRCTRPRTTNPPLTNCRGGVFCGRVGTRSANICCNTPTWSVVAMSWISPAVGIVVVNAAVLLLLVRSRWSLRCNSDFVYCLCCLCCCVVCRRRGGDGGGVATGCGSCCRERHFTLGVGKYPFEHSRKQQGWGWGRGGTTGELHQ